MDHADEARAILTELHQAALDHTSAANIIAQAQVHATLAVADTALKEQVDRERTVRRVLGLARRAHLLRYRTERSTAKETTLIPCPFCTRVINHEYDAQSLHAVSFEPLNPVTPGHLLVVSRLHVVDATEAPQVTADTMHFAAALAKKLGEDCNLITSVGAAATQTVRHLHIHIVPRREGDGLRLPWTGQKK